MIRQEFTQNNKWIRYNMMAMIMKKSDNYQELPAQTAQHILKVLDRSWNSFFKAIKVWKKNKSKFKAMPRLPGYKEKDGEFMLIFTNQQVSVKDGKIVFPKKASFLSGIPFRLKDVKIKEARVIPQPVGYILDVIYEKPSAPPERDPSKVASIDIGVRNLVTVVNNYGDTPFVVKGGTAKAMNQYFNREKSRLVSIYQRQQKTDKRPHYGQKLKRLLVKRNKKMSDYLHKVSRAVIDRLAEDNVGTLVIGHNNDWKQNVNIGKRNNQSFVSIPFFKLINMLTYKAEEQGMKVIIQEESHTSKCSFFDDEPIRHHKEYVGKRNRGLFRTKDKHIVNSDVNGAYNILKKAVPNAFMADGIEGAVGHPLRLAVPF
jgi:putative transposase